MPRATALTRTLWAAMTVKEGDPTVNGSHINSMTRLDGTSASAADALSPLEAVTAADSELSGLVRLNEVLRTMEPLLAWGKAEELPELCREATSTAQDMLSLAQQGSLLGALPVDAERRRSLLLEVRRRHAFCAAMLRRWHRMLLWRREVLSAASDPVTYTPALRVPGELR